MASALRHLLLASVSVALLGLAGAAASALRGQAVTPAPAVLSVEHTQPLSVAVRVARLPGGRLIAFSHGSAYPVRLRLPAQWKRTEVRGATLAEVAREDLAGGIARWTLPAGATMELRTDAAFEEIEVRNPSGIPLSLRLTAADPRTGTAEVQSVLLMDNPAVLRLLPETE